MTETYDPRGAAATIAEPAIDVAGLTVRYGENTVIEDLSAAFPMGAVTTILGPNGCGKSTLLRAIAQLIPAARGTVRVQGDDIGTLTRREVARRIGVLPQSPTAPEGLIVSDLVSRGRHPHQSWLRQWSSTDEEEVHRALELTGSVHLSERRLESLSGGQRQRIWISMVLAQQTEILFLDEPTTYLDMSHAIDVLGLVRSLRKRLGRTIVMVLHDLNMAIRYSDHLVILSEGAIVADGPPAEVITPDLLQEVFGLTAIVVPDPITGAPMVVPEFED